MKITESIKAQIKQLEKDFSTAITLNIVIPFLEKNGLKIDFAMGSVTFHRGKKRVETKKTRALIEKINCLCENTTFENRHCDSVWWILSATTIEVHRELKKYIK